MHRLLTHHREQRFSQRECRGRTACHEGQTASLCPADAARYRRIDRQHAGGQRLVGHGTRRRHVNGRAIDKTAAGCHLRQNIRRHRPQGIAVGKHGDHHLAAGRRLCRAASHRHAVDPHLGQVKPCHLMSGRHQIGRHRCPHIAKSDEPDFHHRALLSLMDCSHWSELSGCGRFGQPEDRGRTDKAAGVPAIFAARPVRLWHDESDAAADCRSP